jgi:dGTPase
VAGWRDGAEPASGGFVGVAVAGYDPADVARLVDEPPKATPGARNPFARDRARVLHSSALRRLAAKTQVVGPLDDDFPRTRLTHSLETAQIGRELAADLGTDPDLVDAACLSHDIGHPPFGHNGELALDEAARTCGGFEGNAQSLRELARLEVKVTDAQGRSVGLNLTRATLDATVKYPWPRPAGQADVPGTEYRGPKFGVYPDDLALFEWVRSTAPQRRRCLEAQIMDWADDVAYSVHDLEDGVVAGHLDLGWLDDQAVRADLIHAAAAWAAPPEPGHGVPVSPASPVSAGALGAALERLCGQPWWVAADVTSARGLAALRRMTSELVARLSRAATSATRERYGPAPLRRYAADLVVPLEVQAECAVLKGMTACFVMGRRDAAARRRRQREVVAELVELLADGAPHSLDPLLRPAWLGAGDDAARLRVVIDQVARLTDASVVRRHAQLTGRPMPRAL